MRPVKPRHPATLHATVVQATADLGVEQFAEVVGRTKGWIRDAGDPERSPPRNFVAEDGVPAAKAARLLYEDARAASRAGTSAFAEDLAALAGGVFVPVEVDPSPLALHALIARFQRESSEATCEMLRGLADNKFDAFDARKALPEIMDAIRAFSGAYAVCLAVAEGDQN